MGDIVIALILIYIHVLRFSSKHEMRILGLFCTDG